MLWFHHDAACFTTPATSAASRPANMRYAARMVGLCSASTSKYVCRGVRKSTWQAKTWRLEIALHVVQGASVSARVSLRGGRGGELCSWQAAGHFDQKRNSEPLPHSDSCGVRRRGLLKLGRAAGQGAASIARRASSLRVQKDSPRIAQAV